MMKKRIISVLLVLAMVLSSAHTLAMAEETENVIDTAEALAAAIQKDGKVVLGTDITLTEGITIPDGADVILDLKGFTISQTKEQTTGYQMILNDGNLTIMDSSKAKSGKISYTDSGNGGEYISDTIYNRGTLVVNGGTIENLSSATVAKNGYPHAVDTYSGIRDVSTTVNGGIIYCAEYSAMRMFCVSATNKADLTINSGATIRGAVDMQNGTKTVAIGSLTINGGTFETTKNANNIRFANWNSNATAYGITASIQGGTFNGGITTQYVPVAANWDSKVITGGTFSQNPSAYVADGYVVASNGTVYTVSKQATKVEVEVEDVVIKNEQDQDVTVNVEAAVGANQAQGSVDVEVKAEEGEDAAAKVEEVKQALVENNVTTSTVQAAVSSNEKTEEHLESVANEVAKEVVTKDLVADAVEALVRVHDGLTVNDVVSEVQIEVKPYLEVVVNNYEENKDGSTTSLLTMHIEAKYDVVATVDNGTKSAVLSTGNTMENVNKTISITVPLPKSFQNAQYVYVRHYKTDAQGNVTNTYNYAAAVSADGKTATFENPNGFSKFELLATDTELEVYEPPKFTTSLTLNETLDMNFYMDVENVGEDAEFKAFINNEEVSVNVTTIESRYRVRYSFQAHQMTQEIKVQCIVNGEVVAERAMSIQSYCAAIFEKHMPTVNTNENSELQCAMAVAVLDYGSLAQIGKGNTSSLANAILTQEQRAVYTSFWTKHNSQ